MAAWWTNKGKADLAAGGIAGRTFRLLVMTAAPASAAAAADLNFVADVVAGASALAARRTLANVVAGEDDVNDRANIDADDPAVYAAMAAGETWKGAWVYRRVGGADADAADILWCWLGMADLPTNGGDVTLALNALGISTIV